MQENVVQEKSCAFASRIIKAYECLVGEQCEFVLSKQLLRSGTSIGATVEEALAASSTANFVNKFNIAAKEARETFVLAASTARQRLSANAGFQFCAQPQSRTSQNYR